MKRMFWIIFAITSLSAFAQSDEDLSCTVLYPYYNLQTQCETCGDGFYGRYDWISPKVLRGLGYDVTRDKNEKTEYVLGQPHTYFDFGSNVVRLQVKMTHVSSGETTILEGTSRIGLFDLGPGPERRAMKKALENFPPCTSL